MTVPPAAPFPVSVLVTTHNEEAMIGACLDSVLWAGDLLVVDSGSTDRTVEIARSRGARVLEHPYEGPAAQKNWALPHCRFERVLILDADEWVPPPLAQEIQRLLGTAALADGYWIPRRNLFLGRQLRHGDWGRDKVIRLVDRDRARYQDRLVHEEIDLSGPVPCLENFLMHDTFRGFRQYWPKVWRYAEHGAIELEKRGRTAGPLAIAGHAAWRFGRGFLLHGGFLDGAPGFVAAAFDSFQTFLKYALLWERSRRAGIKP